jgi:uncharacterized membrane protein
VKRERNEPEPKTTPGEGNDETEFVPGEELPPGSDSGSLHPRQVAPESPAVRIERSKPDQPSSVEVLQDVIGLITTPEIAPAAAKAGEEQRKINEVVHGMLVLGLGVSTAVMCMGIALSLVFHYPLPSTLSPLRQIIEGLDRLNPSSYLSLGILLLIATPILRVFGSLIEFIITRDLPYAGLTLLVLIILASSVLVGRG